MKMLHPILKKGSSGDKFNIFNSNPKLVVPISLEISAYKRLTTIIKGFYDIPDQNVSLS